MWLACGSLLVARVSSRWAAAGRSALREHGPRRGRGDVEGRRGVGEVLLFRGADDGGGYDRVAQDPGQRDLGHRHAVLFGGLLDGVRDGLVVVGQHPAGDVVGVAAGGLLAPGPGETALRE